MIIDARDIYKYLTHMWMSKGRTVACPWGHHYHGGDEIEIGLEMIICQDKANKCFSNIWER
jgi:hypothetical protein